MSQQKVVLKVLTMTDDKTKQKAMEAAADIYGVESIAAEEKEGKLTVIGNMDAVALLKKVKKKVGKVDILSVGPAAAMEDNEKKKNEEEEKKKKKAGNIKEEKKPVEKDTKGKKIH
ncbi:hypothetical protein DM860_010914 [Cuscuta australis]|uniref:HMA domain-containing protein n=1 Tax=Cuscuta australis TaxID=267555 RepID=A0A328E0B1_9ASTE|nr:hypothetical protein DM860_010914 [Cuscuta australis]